MTSDTPMDAAFTDAAREARASVAADAGTLLDVRRDDEWAAGHAAGALHWELGRLQRGDLPDIPKDRRVYVHCAAGGRAGTAKGILEDAGWRQVTNIGGLKHWQAAGGPIAAS